MSYEAGSVNVKATLDTTQFTSSINNMRTELTNLQNSFNSINGGKTLETIKAEFTGLKQAISELGSSINGLKETLSTLFGSMENVKNAAASTSESFTTASSSIGQLQSQYMLLGESSSVASSGMLQASNQVRLAVTEEISTLEQLTSAYQQVVDVDYIVLESAIETSSAFQEEALAAGEAASEVALLANEQRMLASSSTGASTAAAEMKAVSSSAASAGAGVEAYGNKASTAKDRVNELDKASGLLRRTLSLLVVTAGVQLVSEIGEATWSMINARESTKSFARMCGWSTDQVNRFVDKGRELQTTYTKIDMSQVTSQVAQLAHQYNLTEQQAEGMIETSAVFTAAMAREGRSAEDATLALKDYYDQGTGWARRMQEVGVTEEKLKATGLWNGQKDDIEGMNAALGEVLRQMNIYEEAMSVNSPQEAWESLKTVIAEVGAELFEFFSGDLTQVMKGVIWLVVQLHNAISGIKDWFNGLDEPAQFFVHWLAIVGVGALGAVVGIRKLIGPVTRLVAAFKEWKNLSWFEKVFGKGSGSSGYKMEDKFPGKDIEKDVEETDKDVGRVDKASKKFDKAEFKNKLKNMASKFALAGAAIGMTFALIGEVLLGIWVTLWALGEVGKQYQRYKPQIQLAIQGMIEIAPVLVVLGAAVWGVGLALDKLKVKTKDILSMGLKSGVAIGATFALIAEVLAGVYASVYLIAGIGSIDNGNVQKGVDILTTVAPILVVLGVAVSVFMIALQKLHISTSQIIEGFKTAAVGIAAALTLVAETILMIVPSLLALYAVAWVSDWLGGASTFNKAIEAIDCVTQVFNMLAPYAPFFIVAAIGLGVLIVDTGFIALGYAAVGIAAALALIAETILMMVAPLMALGAVGWVADVVGDYAEKGVAAIEATIDAIGRIVDAIVDTVFESIMNAISKISNLAFALNELGYDLMALSPGIQLAAAGIFALQGALSIVSAAFIGISIQGLIDGIVQWAMDIINMDGFESIKTAMRKIADLARSIANSNMPDSASIYATSSAITAVNGVVDNIELTGKNIVDSANNLPDEATITEAGNKIIKALEAITNIGTKLSNSNGNNSSLSVSNLTTFINSLVTTLKNGVTQILSMATLYTMAGMVLGTALSTGLIASRSTVGAASVTMISQAIVSIQNRYNTFYNAGRTSGVKTAEGLRTGMAAMVNVAKAELNYTLNAINSYYQKFYDAGKRLGEAETKGYQDGQDMHSPGIIARSTADEMQRVEDYIYNAIPNVENAAYQLGNSFSEAYTNNMSISGQDPSLTNAQYSQIQANAMTLTSLTNQATNTALTDFNSLETGMAGTFNQMGTTAVNTFTGINSSNQQYLNQLNNQTRTGMANAATTTKNQLNQMQQSTTSTVSKMNNAWTSMSNHIVNAASQIRTQSYNKFSSLHRSISSFYNQLASAHFTAGLATGPSPLGHSKRVKVGEYGGNTGGRIRAFGSKVSKRIHNVKNSYGGLDKISNSRLSRLYLELLDNPNPYLLEQLRALGNPDDYYGTVSSNYQRIKNTVDQYSVADPYFLGIQIPMNNHVYDWEDGKTKRIDASNFEEILSLVLTARGFRNPSTYSYYANGMKSNQQVWDSLSCNCYDGAEMILEIGQMLGLSGSLVHGSWKGEGHMGAMIAGKLYDMTQFQKHGVFRGTPGVVFGPGKQSKVQRNTYGNSGNTGSEHVSKGNVTVNIDMSNTTVYGDDSFIDKMKQMITDEIYKAQGLNPSTGL